MGGLLLPDLPGLACPCVKSGHLPVDGQRGRFVSSSSGSGPIKFKNNERWLTRYQNESDRIEAVTERGRTTMDSQRQPADRLSHERGNQVREK